MKRSVKLYIAYSTVDYEGGSVHGIFSTRKRAEKALERAKKASRFANHYEIAEVLLNVDVDLKGGGLYI